MPAPQELIPRIHRVEVEIVRGVMRSWQRSPLTFENLYLAKQYILAHIGRNQRWRIIDWQEQVVWWERRYGD